MLSKTLFFSFFNSKYRNNQDVHQVYHQKEPIFSLCAASKGGQQCHFQRHHILVQRSTTITDTLTPYRHFFVNFGIVSPMLEQLRAIHGLMNSLGFILLLINNLRRSDAWSIALWREAGEAEEVAVVSHCAPDV